MSIKVRLSENLPLQLLLPDGDESLYPLAYVETEEHTPLPGSPFALVSDSLGNYTNDDYIIAPDSPYRRFIATFVVYEDPEHTVESQFYQRASETYDMVDSPNVYVNQLSTYVNRMSTVYDQSTKIQQIVMWPEKNGQAALGTNCSISIIDFLGATVWAAAATTPRSDGTFRFTHNFEPTVDGTYYVQSSIIVDGHPRLNKQPFVALG